MTRIPLLATSSPDRRTQGGHGELRGAVGDSAQVRRALAGDRRDVDDQAIMTLDALRGSTACIQLYAPVALIAIIWSHCSGRMLGHAAILDVRCPRN